jgi:hypothetical protein
MTFPAGTRVHYRDLRLTLPARARPTDTGIATIGCQANELGVKPQVAPTGVDIFHSFESMRSMLNGCERWDAVEHEDVGVDEWVMEKVAGPLHVDGVEGRAVIECDECGWRGPWREDRRLLAGDAQHACFDPVPLPLDL